MKVIFDPKSSGLEAEGQVAAANNDGCPWVVAFAISTDQITFGLEFSPVEAVRLAEALVEGASEALIGTTRQRMGGLT